MVISLLLVANLHRGLPWVAMGYHGRVVNLFSLCLFLLSCVMIDEMCGGGEHGRGLSVSQWGQLSRLE